jgi:hypothetical protein
MRKLFLSLSALCFIGMWVAQATDQGWFAAVGIGFVGLVLLVIGVFGREQP